MYQGTMIDGVPFGLGLIFYRTNQTYVYTFWNSVKFKETKAMYYLEQAFITNYYHFKGSTNLYDQLGMVNITARVMDRSI